MSIFPPAPIRRWRPKTCSEAMRFLLDTNIFSDLIRNSIGDTISCCPAYASDITSESES